MAPVAFEKRGTADQDGEGDDRVEQDLQVRELQDDRCFRARCWRGLLRREPPHLLLFQLVPWFLLLVELLLTLLFRLRGCAFPVDRPLAAGSGPGLPALA